MSCAEDQRHPGQAPDTNPELLRRALLIDLKMDHRAALGEDPGPQRYAASTTFRNSATVPGSCVRPRVVQKLRNLCNLAGQAQGTLEYNRGMIYKLFLFSLFNICVYNLDDIITCPWNLSSIARTLYVLVVLPSAVALFIVCFQDGRIKDARQFKRELAGFIEDIGRDEGWSWEKAQYILDHAYWLVPWEAAGFPYRY